MDVYENSTTNSGGSDLSTTGSGDTFNFYTDTETCSEEGCEKESPERMAFCTKHTLRGSTTVNIDWSKLGEGKKEYHREHYDGAGRCPRCGYCPHCGRGGLRPGPVWY